MTSVRSCLAVTKLESETDWCNESWSHGSFPRHTSEHALVSPSLSYNIKRSLISLRKVIMQRSYLKTFLFVNSHLTASNRGELANQNTAYKIIALEFFFSHWNRVQHNLCSVQLVFSTARVQHNSCSPQLVFSTTRVQCRTTHWSCESLVFPVTDIGLFEPPVLCLSACVFECVFFTV